MPRIATDLTPLLPTLRAAREAIESGALVQGTRLAELAGTTWRVLKKRIIRDATFPVVERGVNGRAWTFDAAAALDHMIAGLERQTKGKQKRAAMVARQSGMAFDPVDLPDVDDPLSDDAPAMDDPMDVAASARSISLLANAQMQTHRLKQMQGEFVRADDHTRVIATIMSTMQTETLAIASKVDPAGTLPVEVRGQLEDELKNVLLAVKSACDKDLRAISARKN
jgi:hypothetical protein